MSGALDLTADAEQLYQQQSQVAHALGLSPKEPWPVLLEALRRRCKDQPPESTVPRVRLVEAERDRALGLLGQVREVLAEETGLGPSLETQRLIDRLTKFVWDEAPPVVEPPKPVPTKPHPRSRMEIRRDALAQCVEVITRAIGPQGDSILDLLFIQLKAVYDAIPAKPAT